MLGSAIAQAFTTRSLNDGSTSAPLAFSSARSSTHCVMSTVARSVNVGIVARDSAMRRAMSDCVRVGSVIVTSPFALPALART